VAQKRIEAHNLGQKAFELPDEAKLDAVKCLKLLSPYGKTLLNAVDFYLEHLEITQKSCTVLFLKLFRQEGVDLVIGEGHVLKGLKGLLRFPICRISSARSSRID